MPEHKTDKELLVKGVKYLLITMALFFAGPTLIYIARSNQDKDFNILILAIGIAICIAAVFFGFKGINTIMSSLFNSKK